jgi:hypothetical protein
MERPPRYPLQQCFKVLFRGLLKRNHNSRTTVYHRPLFTRDDCPINKDLLPDFDALFYEPFN